MARPNPPCTVPGCKGSLEPGKKDGKAVEFCPVCERRIHQLAALHKKIADAEQGTASRETKAAPVDLEALDDRQLLALVRKRTMLFKEAVRESRRGANAVREALTQDRIVAWPLNARMCLISRQSLRAWIAQHPPRYLTSIIVAAVPRDASAARTAREIAAASGVAKTSVYTWLSRAKQETRLQRLAKLNENGEPVLAYWWQEGPNA